MSTRDLHNNILVKRAISPVVITNNTASVSQIIDTRGFQSLEFVIATGTISDADTTVTVLVEDGDNSALSDAAAVVDAELLGTEAQAGFQFDDDDEVRKIGYIGNKRYVRLTITPANNTGNIPVACLAILANTYDAPVTQSAS
jgi:hypothetical protein